MLLEALSPVTATTTTATLAAPPDSDYVGKGAAKQSKILVCGPPAMLAAVARNKGRFVWMQGRVGGMLQELGVDKAQVVKF